MACEGRKWEWIKYSMWNEEIMKKRNDNENENSNEK
jgi:hypothetical protein